MCWFYACLISYIIPNEIKKAITSDKYVRYNVRLNNDACHEKFRNVIYPMDNRNVQSQYDEFTQYISVAFNKAYPFKEIWKKEKWYFEAPNRQRP